MKGFLDYLPGNSVLHKAHPLSKIFLAICICASSFISNSYVFLLLLILLNLILAFISDMDFKNNKTFGVLDRTFKMLFGLIKISVFLFVLQILIIRTGNAIFTFKSFFITDKGLRNGLLLVLRLIGATLPLSIIISITNLADLSNTLVKCLHLPYKYAFTFTTAIRFIPVFSLEMNNIMEAQTSRGIDFETKNPFKKIALVLPLCAPLLISSVRKIDSIAIATELRGFHLRNASSCSKEYTFSFFDFMLIFFGITIVAVSLFFIHFV